MMKSKTWVLMAILGLGIALLLGSVAQTAPMEMVRLSEVVRSVFYAPQYVAIEKGFFADEGLRVDLSTAWGADKGAAALLSGSVDIGFFGPEAAIYIYQQGASDYIVGFAQLTATDGSFFMARDVEEDFSWENVRGNTIVGARRGGVPQMVLEWVLKSYGVEPFHDVEVITNLAFEAAVGAFQAGVGDYIAQFEPAVSTVEAQGGGKIVASLGEEAGPITYTVYHARQRTIEQRPDMLARFTRGLHRGQEWVAEHSAEEVAVVVAGFFPAVEHGILISTIERYQSIGAWPQTPVISEEGFSNLQAIMKAAGELDEFVPFYRLMDNRIAREVVD